jgi:hypothetical protein
VVYTLAILENLTAEVLDVAGVPHLLVRVYNVVFMIFVGKTTRRKNIRVKRITPDLCNSRFEGMTGSIAICKIQCQTVTSGVGTRTSGSRSHAY